MENTRRIKLQPQDRDLHSSAVKLDERIDSASERVSSGGGQIVKERKRAQTSDKRVYEAVKRCFDIIGSAIGLIVLIPVFALISLIIWAEHTGKHVVYKQRRIGRGGKEIYIYKFRSMVDDADNVEKWLNEKQLRQYYTEFKVEDDPRVTKIGKFLRRTGLDELPQILNILKGELSIVGPRPIQEYELKFYGESVDELLSVRPGLTGYWQAYCGDGVGYQNGERQRMELNYIKKRSLLFDIKICFATFGALVRKAKRGQ